MSLRLLTTSEMIIAIFLTMALIVTTSLTVSLQSYAVKGVKLGHVEFTHMDKTSCVCHLVQHTIPENPAQTMEMARRYITEAPLTMGR